MLAFDLGASNGRAVYGKLSDGCLKSREIHRFSNEPVWAGGKLYWDVLRLFHEMKAGIRKCCEEGLKVDCMGLNSWGNTIGMFDKQGDLIGNPYHYRDGRVEKTMGEFYERNSREWLFSQTLYQPMTIQPTVFLDYIRKEKPWMMETTDTVLMISDVFNYFLTGIKASEKTMAATSSMVDIRTGAWSETLMEALEIPAGWFPGLIENGTVLGRLSEDISREAGLPERPQVIAVAGHDTAAASGCIGGAKEDSLYLSCGTWSCMGCTIEKPVDSRELLEAGITNDLGLYGSVQLRFNHTGLWILQECERYWRNRGIRQSWQEINKEIKAATPFLAAIDTEADTFFKPGEMPEKIQDFCRQTGQKVPVTRGEIYRVVLESLVYRYRYSADCLQSFAGYSFRKMTIMGGGSRNPFLCQWTANILNRPVTAGVWEASVMGNFLQQGIAMGAIRDLEQGISIAAATCKAEEYFPNEQQKWEEQYIRFTKKFDWKQIKKSHATQGEKR